MTTSRVTPSDWMWTDGNEKVQSDDIIITTRGWEKVHPNGQKELIHAMKTILAATSLIVAVTNFADGDYDDAEEMTFTIEWDGAVVVNTTGGTPSIQVYTEAGTLIDIPYVSGSTTDTLTFTGALTGIADGNLVVVEELAFNGGTILHGGAPVDNDFPADYVQPTITMTTA